ncbi:MAG TPA: nucleotidyltransferase domain-containing protein [Candidatus Binatia bacterium]|jgi:hypothetical protein|nr:nucleotidyltransferase domain-containing protein [Candidatus Binatia bacterium]
MTSTPPEHRAFLARALDVLAADDRIVGVAAGGSYVTDTVDEWSDIDLVVAVAPAHVADVMRERQTIAASLGPLLSAFTGEHVGEPRLLICLYDGPSPLHVDLKFVSLPDVATRVEDPLILLDRDDRLAAALRTGTARYPAPDPQWIEDRFWTWIHYGAAKIDRGELFETLDVLSFLRGAVLGPLGLQRAGARPTGVRRVEMLAPELAEALRATVASHDARDCARALLACAEVYRRLRPTTGVERRTATEDAAMRYLADVTRRT